MAKGGRLSIVSQYQEAHTVQNPNVLLTILSSMAKKPQIQFGKLFQKLYNKELWLMAYEQIAANPGNMTPGVNGKTADGMSMKLVETMIADLKAARYKPNPARREYIDKPNGGQRPIGIPSFEDKLLQTVVKLILEAIYEPTFSDKSHGFRPHRSCHTALTQVKRLTGIRWWVEGDIKGFFDNLNHDTLLRILSKRITDKRFLHLIGQFLQAGYYDNWKYHDTYSGTPQGSNLSPILSNIYLNELDQMMERKIAEFNKGKVRAIRPEYRKVQREKRKAKKAAQQTGDWTGYKALTQQQLTMQAGDPQDPNYRRMYYVRYADDFLIGIIGSKDDAQQTKAWLAEYLKQELHLELSAEKTLITHVEDRVRFLGYDIVQWAGQRVKRHHSPTWGVRTMRSSSRHLALLMPQDKVHNFCKTYGKTANWYGEHRNSLTRFSELEILHIYNAEVRGFLNYYALADNQKRVGAHLLWMTCTSFFKTLAKKRKSSVKKVSQALKRGPSRYVVTLEKDDGTTREYELLASTRQLQHQTIRYDRVDMISNTWYFKAKTELGQRLRANRCEWCGKTEGTMEVHHVRRLKDLKGKEVWEVHMIARRRKTMVLCENCHVDLHAGRLTEATKAKS
jgi:group II intron reverse transcriptase/maturase